MTERAFDNAAFVAERSSTERAIRKLGGTPPARKVTIQERFEHYDAEHPEVYRLFKRFAGELRSAGRQHYGAKAIIERIRWHYAIQKGGEEFKINNDYPARYARKLLQEEPEFDGFFELRELKTA